MGVPERLEVKRGILYRAGEKQGQTSPPQLRALLLLRFPGLKAPPCAPSPSHLPPPCSVFVRVLKGHKPR